MLCIVGVDIHKLLNLCAKGRWFKSRPATTILVKSGLCPKRVTRLVCTSLVTLTSKRCLTQGPKVNDSSAVVYIDALMI